MFISVKRHEREKQELIAAGNRLTDAILNGSAQGLFLLDAKGKILPQVSASLATLFRRQEFANLTLEKLIGPLVSAKTLGAARTFLARLLDAAAPDDAGQENPLQDVEVRLVNPDGSFDAAHYSFEFNTVDLPREPRSWLVQRQRHHRARAAASRARGSTHARADPGRNTAQRLARREARASAPSCSEPTPR